MVRQSNLKLDENIGNYEPWRINKWFKENGIAELVDYVRIPRESCHPFHTKVATDSTQNLPLIP